MPTRRLPPINDYERGVLTNVEQYGWHCTSVTQRERAEDFVPFSYTVGLFDRFGASELIVFGLDENVAHSIFKIYVNRLWVGEPIPLDEACADLIQNYSCAFVPVPRTRYNEFVFSALWFYAEVEFPLHQLVWPDADGAYPWSPGVGPDFLTQQPVLALDGVA